MGGEYLGVVTPLDSGASVYAQHPHTDASRLGFTTTIRNGSRGLPLMDGCPSDFHAALIR